MRDSKQGRKQPAVRVISIAQVTGWRWQYQPVCDKRSILVARQNGLRKAESPRGRAAKRTSQAKPSKPPRSESKGNESPLDTAQRALKGAASFDKAGKQLGERVLCVAIAAKQPKQP